MDFNFVLTIIFSNSTEGSLGWSENGEKRQTSHFGASCWQIPHFRESPSLAYAWYVHSKNILHYTLSPCATFLGPSTFTRRGGSGEIRELLNINHDQIIVK